MQEFKLDKFQEEAIEYARKNHSVIVSAPTGAGKTLIAEYIIEDCIQQNKGVIYTAPIKALSNQKFRDFSKKYPNKTGILTGDVSINRDAPILIMTTEIFRNAILVEPDDFKNRDWVIFDEIHYLDDIERGTVWEETIILLPPHMRMLALSATLPNIEEFINWLKKVHKFPFKAVIEETRPVPLHFFFQCNNEFYPGFKELTYSNLLQEKLKVPPHKMAPLITRPNRINTLIEHLKRRNNYPCVYFSFSRKRCEDLAQEISNYDFLTSKEKQQITALFEGLLEKFNLSLSPHINFLFPLIKRGIAYHHAGLLPTLKEIIEQLFTSGLIKVIFTTETFALGINMPARTVIFDALTKFYGRYHGYLKVRDFYQMAGRAGRRGIDEEGYVFSRVNPHHIDINSLRDIIYGDYEPIKSQLNSCYATILNLYRIMGDKIYDIYPDSFHFHQAKIWEKKETLGLLKRKISLLRDLSYIVYPVRELRSLTVNADGGIKPSAAFSNGVNSGISCKADLASKVYSFELPIGELFENGFLNNIDEESLFTVITALVYEPRRGANLKLNKKVNALKRDLDNFTRQIHRRERQFRIYPLSKRFYFYLSDACLAWFEGSSFTRLSKFCDIDEGEIVRYFRMSIQVFREIYSSRAINEPLKTKILHCLKRINRDEVDAEKQLRQEI